MNYNLYCYYDRVSGIYSAPVPAVNRAVAIRSFISLFKDPQNAITAADMELYEVGTFNTLTGDIVSCKATFVCRAEEYLNGGANE